MTELDVRVFRLLHEALSGGWLLPMAVLSVIGGGWGSLALVPMLAAARTRPMAKALAGVLAATAILVFVLKRLVARARPCACLPGMKALVFAPPTDASFPSGHAAGSFAFAVFVAIVLVRAAKGAPPGERALRFGGAATLLLLAFGVGLSRIALGVHFPGDVLAGAFLGALAASVGAHWARFPSR